MCVCVCVVWGRVCVGCVCRRGCKSVGVGVWYVWGNVTGCKHEWSCVFSRPISDEEVCGVRALMNDESMCESIVKHHLGVCVWESMLPFFKKNVFTHSYRINLETHEAFIHHRDTQTHFLSQDCLLLLYFSAWLTPAVVEAHSEILVLAQFFSINQILHMGWALINKYVKMVLPLLRLSAAHCGYFLLN